MEKNPLQSLIEYSNFVQERVARGSIHHSTVSVWSDSRYTGIADGEVFFHNGFRLRMREEVDFEAGMLISYGYEVYRGDNLLYRYDDIPHPDDPSLKPTFPHHKHVPPNISRNRIPAPGLSFTKPNLPFILDEIESLFSK
jgi:hypothetical protein